jgi:hypothetical protein
MFLDLRVVNSGSFIQYSGSKFRGNEDHLTVFTTTNQLIKQLVKTLNYPDLSTTPLVVKLTRPPFFLSLFPVIVKQQCSVA